MTTSHWSTLKPGERKLGSDEVLSESGGAAGQIILNHTCIKISDPDRSLRFYREVLGFQEVMTWNTGPQTVIFISQPIPGIATSEVFKSMQSRAGLIELLYLHGTQPTPSKENALLASSPLGYFHIGLSVPDVAAVLAKADAYDDEGVRIVKTLGPPSSMAVMGLPSDTPAFHNSTDFIFSKVAFITDPDGNWIELVPQAMHKAKEVTAQ